MKNVPIPSASWNLAVLLCLCLASTPLFAQPAPQNPPEAVPAPLAVVAGFLDLSQAQAGELVRLRGVTEAALREIGLLVKMREERLAQEFESDRPEVALIGGLVVQVRALRQEASQRQRDFQESFASLLDEEQQGRLQQVLRAAALQDVLPAFRAMGVLR